MSIDTTSAATPNLIGRLFGLEKNEFVAVAWSFVYFFCVLSAYYMLRPVRETMGVAGGVENIPWLFSATFVSMMFATTIFGWIASKFPRKRFLPWVYFFFVANILLFHAGFSYSIRNEIDYVWLGRVFFVWISVFNLFVVSVFWSFMADIYSQEQGRRLFGLISAGGSTGALLGPLATSQLSVVIGFENMLPMSACLLLCAILCIYRLRDWLETNQSEAAIQSAISDRPIGGHALGGVMNVLKSKYLALICAASVIASLLGLVLYLFIAELVSQIYIDVNARTQFYARVDAATNALAMLGQLLLVRHSVKRFGIGITLCLMPIVSFLGFALLAASPILPVVAAIQILRRGIGFGFSKPTTDMLYSVLTPEQKYKAKNFIDTAVYRVGDVAGIWGVSLLLPIMGFVGVSLAMLPFAVLWGVVAIWLGRDYRRRDRLRAKEVKT